MGGNESIAAGKSDSTANIKQTSAPINGAVGRCRNNLQMVQNILLIWLDKNVDESRADYHTTLTELLRTVNAINTYRDGEECIRFLETIKEEKVCMVISGSLGENIMPRVHNMPQVDSIFIFCRNKEYHEEWAKKWPKIKGVFTGIRPICEAIKQVVQQCEQNAISMSFMAPGENISQKNLDQLDRSFMYTKILKEVLQTIKFEENHFKDFIAYCRDVFADNDGELKNMNELERDFRDETSIRWYTFDHFLYSILNRSLRLMDVDVIIKMSFFINDLQRHIARLHKQQVDTQKSGKNFMVYRGQGISKSEFEQMSQAIGGLMSFNNFLSTSKNREMSLNFASSTMINPDLVGVLFIMTIDPSQSTTSFASIADASYDKDREDEILFAMHTVFRIYDVKPIDGNQRLYQVNLTLANENDRDLRQLTNRIREETEGLTGWDLFGELLLKTGQTEKADQVYHILLRHKTKEIDYARIYHQLGKTKGFLGEYKEAILFNEQAIAIRQRLLSPNHPDLAKSYHNIGLTYYNMGEYSKALSYYEKTLEIDKKILPSNHPDLAMSYNNIGLAYEHLDQYTEAYSFYEWSVNIGERSLPPNHPELQKYRRNLDIIKKKL